MTGTDKALREAAEPTWQDEVDAAVKRVKASDYTYKMRRESFAWSQQKYDDMDTLSKAYLASLAGADYAASVLKSQELEAKISGQARDAETPRPTASPSAE